MTDLLQHRVERMVPAGFVVATAWDMASDEMLLRITSPDRRFFVDAAIGALNPRRMRKQLIEPMVKALRTKACASRPRKIRSARA